MSKEFERKLLEAMKEQVTIMDRVWSRIEIMQSEIDKLHDKHQELEQELRLCR